ncbi:hypothetical protein EIP91_002635 [Steccherinum ochraceum]|uniref:Uncharacterized protein n=1 Tax=Steccherinum ochraceum TaxID=92696 RepID=A0A4R0RVA2_9APHY|nr:hypothetical protein EIP91_002635 [Steccherinum ochraceum]
MQPTQASPSIVSLNPSPLTRTLSAPAIIQSAPYGREGNQPVGQQDAQTPPELSGLSDAATFTARSFSAYKRTHTNEDLIRKDTNNPVTWLHAAADDQPDYYYLPSESEHPDNVLVISNLNIWTEDRIQADVTRGTDAVVFSSSPVYEALVNYRVNLFREIPGVAADHRLDLYRYLGEYRIERVEAEEQDADAGVRAWSSKLFAEHVEMAQFVQKKGGSWFGPFSEFLTGERALPSYKLTFQRYSPLYVESVAEAAGLR